MGAGVTGEPRLRARAIVLGLALIPLLCWWSMRTEIISGGSEMIEASLLVIVVFVLFVLVLLNEAVKRFLPRLALTRAELIVVYIMQTTSVGLAGLGQIQFLNQALGGIFYYATPENGWKELHPYVPRWWVPQEAVLNAYYKGNSTFFTPAHLLGWMVPIVVWSGFILLMLCCFLCLNTLLRKSWIDQERLTFPLVALPLELTQGEATRSLLRQRSFWFAFVCVCLLRSISGVHKLYPSFPDIPNIGGNGQLIDLSHYFTAPPWNALGYFVLSFHPMIVGITYFLPQDVSFSAWFFYLVVKAENIAAAAFGYRAAGASAASQAIPYTGEQGAGAFLAIALFSFWMARRHLRAVFRAAFTPNSKAGLDTAESNPGNPNAPIENRPIENPKPKIQNPKSDADEPLSYRTAVFGFLASFVGLVAFVSLGGMKWYLAAIFFLLYLLMITTVTRLRAEAGPMLNYGPDMNPHRMMVLLPGSRSWDAADLVPFAYLQWFDSDYRTVAMPQQMEALKMAEAVQIPSRRLSVWILLGGGLAAVAAFVSVLALYYHYGATTPRGDNDWRIENGQMPFEMVKSWLETPMRPDPTRLEWIAVGFLITVVLIRGRALFFWWPFHPAGFALAHAGYAMPWVWFPTLLGWLAKMLILRYGGMKLYRAGIPWFMGLILGDIVIACLWSILGVVLNTQMYMFFPG